MKKSIKQQVKDYFEKLDIKNKIVVDLPAGSGYTSNFLHDLGAITKPYDLFPEYFQNTEIECQQLDVTKHDIPIQSESVDIVICQEGIEHFCDQLSVFRKFNRILKKNGELLITTPSYSNLLSKFSYLLFESEIPRRMPPNEIDDVWMNKKEVRREIYHGHIFLIGIQKLRTLAKLSGFSIVKINFTGLSKSSLLLFPFIYPIIFIKSYLVYIRWMYRKNKSMGKNFKKQTYLEQLKLNISPKVLLSNHTFILFKKEDNLIDLEFGMEETIKPFSSQT